jgi:hypothetical protein
MCRHFITIIFFVFLWKDETTNLIEPLHSCNNFTLKWLQ